MTSDIIMDSFSVTTANIAINDILLKTRFFELHMYRRLYWSIFDHFDVISPDSCLSHTVFKLLHIID